jgi:hypothetical protein
VLAAVRPGRARPGHRQGRDRDRRSSKNLVRNLHVASSLAPCARRRSASLAESPCAEVSSWSRSATSVPPGLEGASAFGAGTAIGARVPVRRSALLLCVSHVRTECTRHASELARSPGHEIAQRVAAAPPSWCQTCTSRRPLPEAHGMRDRVEPRVRNARHPDPPLCSCCPRIIDSAPAHRLARTAIHGRERSQGCRVGSVRCPHRGRAVARGTLARCGIFR